MNLQDGGRWEDEAGAAISDSAAPRWATTRLVAEDQALAAIEGAWQAGSLLRRRPQYATGSRAPVRARAAGVPARDFVLSTKVGRILTPRKTAARTPAVQTPAGFDYHSTTAPTASCAPSRTASSAWAPAADISSSTPRTRQPARAARGVLRQAMDSGTGPGPLRARDDLGLRVGNNHADVQAVCRAGDFDCFMIATRSCYTLLQQETSTGSPLCVQRNTRSSSGGRQTRHSRQGQRDPDFNYAPPPRGPGPRPPAEPVSPATGSHAGRPLHSPGPPRGRERVPRESGSSGSDVSALAHRSSMTLAELKAEQLILAGCP